MFAVFFMLTAALFALAVLVFWIYMLVDCMKHEEDKIAWVLVLLFANWLGALIYFFVRFGKNDRTTTRSGFGDYGHRRPLR